MPRKSVDTKKSGGREKSNRTAIIVGALFLGVVVTAGSVMWGRSDAGQIDVSATIQNSQNTAVRDENTPPPLPVISNELSEMRNGGLLPQTGDSVLAPTPIPVPDSVASSTASTTEENTDGSGEAEGAQETEVSESEAQI
jgi:hypothetical protein